MNKQAGAHVRQRVQRDKTPSDPVCRGWPGLQHSLGRVWVPQSAPRGIRPGVSPAYRTTREDLMTRMAMVIPLGRRNPHRPGRATSARVIAPCPGSHPAWQCVTRDYAGTAANTRTAHNRCQRWSCGRDGLHRCLDRPRRHRGRRSYSSQWSRHWQMLENLRRRRAGRSRLERSSSTGRACSLLTAWTENSRGSGAGPQRMAAPGSWDQGKASHQISLPHHRSPGGQGRTQASRPGRPPCINHWRRASSATTRRRASAASAQITRICAEDGPVSRTQAGPRRTAGLRASSPGPATQCRAADVHNLEADLRPIRRDRVGRSPRRSLGRGPPRRSTRRRQSHIVLALTSDTRHESALRASR